MLPAGQGLRGSHQKAKFSCPRLSLTWYLCYRKLMNQNHEESNGEIQTPAAGRVSGSSPFPKTQPMGNNFYFYFFSVKMSQGHFTSGFVAASRTARPWGLNSQASSFNSQVITLLLVPASSSFFFFWAYPSSLSLALSCVLNTNNQVHSLETELVVYIPEHWRQASVFHPFLRGQRVVLSTVNDVRPRTPQIMHHMKV